MLLILYGFTGSVAAFAAHDNCAHPLAAPAIGETVQTAALAPAHGEQIEQNAAELDDCSCDGLCHLTTAADLHAGVNFGLHRQHGAVLVRARSDHWPSRPPHVPTPPPNVVSRLS